MIEEADDRGARRRDTRVPSGRNAPIHAMTNTANARVCVMSSESRYLIRRTVIDNHNLEFRNALCQDTVDRAAQPVDPLKGRNDHADRRLYQSSYRVHPK
jgi:hypothetical protein